MPGKRRDRKTQGEPDRLTAAVSQCKTEHLRFNN